MKSFAVAACILAAFSSCAAHAQGSDAAAAPGADFAKIERTAKALEALVETSGFKGEIAIKGRDFDIGLSGTRSARPAGVKAERADLWRYASVTKQFIAVLVMQEVAAGQITLDVPISRYLPKFKGPTASKITVRQLLRHQSGLPNPDDSADYYQPGYKGDRRPLTGYCAGKPKAEPGGNWAYNNCDFIIAGAVLEAVTRKPWQKLVQDKIAKPLSLTSIGAYPAKAWVRGGTVGGEAEPKLDLASFGASAALYGSADDLLRFDQALMSGKLLPKAQLDELWDGQPSLGFIALGQWVFDAPLTGCAAPVRLVERRGSVGGVQVRNFIFPEKGTAIVVFSEKSEGDFEFGEIWQGRGFSHDLLNLVLCQKAAPSK